MAGFFEKLKKGLEKTRNSFTDRINEVFQVAVYIDDDMYDELEEALITSDVGARTADEIIERLREKIRTQKISRVKDVKPALAEVIAETLNQQEPAPLDFPLVMLIIGVNGVGKTTSIGKLAYRFKEEGKKVLVAAGDTFRAAAIDQLEIWANRAGVDIIRHQEGSDPAATVYDSLIAARARQADVLLIDTAGRLHNKKNLMKELEKINRIIDREYPSAHKQSLLVLDATTGQNAINQAQEFQSVVNIDGIILTKLDGTAKGGVVLSISQTLGVPVRYIGVGEGIDDVQEFDAAQFATLLLDSDLDLEQFEHEVKPE
ncbi:signal recognition particle-docking protein FtsY [Proteiniclasticum sp. QWL-01]|uniref:signal recognition particle-docking protein FtsY n=1 Tax=Proteiniclasticum sp. QWL-01 TaxID=3036945 RepID=UPI002206DF65|nr:signal recognition particle-docking protein FtsY [Proteiniclasticum sp. QWL-01]UUM12705.1 signal recognition particle-docking protein FtsY [Clostridiaceae bacterium HFYG-1003]WFF74256.1 signal recognition particle-docking protein FtsY [Proteiniclasticum sp. QWL-01]